MAIIDNWTQMVHTLCGDFFDTAKIKTSAVKNTEKAWKTAKVGHLKNLKFVFALKDFSWRIKPWKFHEILQWVLCISKTNLKINKKC